MKAPERDILERNLELLIGRCYTPVQPQAEYRQQLRERFDAALRSTSKLETSGTRTGSLRLLPRILVPLAAAAALLFVFLQTNEPDPVRSREELLAAGEVAWRIESEENWQSWNPAESSALPNEAFEMFTPDGQSARLELASNAGDVLVGSKTHVAAGRPEPDRRVSIELEYGELTLARFSTSESERREAGEQNASSSSELKDSPWLIRSPEASVRLAYGELRARRSRGSNELEVLLSSGLAFVRDGNSWNDLRVGITELLSEDRLGVRQAELEAPEGPSDRIAVAADTAPEPEELPLTETARPVSIAIHVATEADSLPVTNYRLSLFELTLMPELRSPQVYSITDSEDGRVEVSGLSPGRYSVDVFAEGLAPWRENLIEVDNNEPVQLNVLLGPGLGLRGTVLDPNGNPLPGAVVATEAETPPRPIPMETHELRDILMRSTTTDERGQFALSNLRPGSHVLMASHADFAPGWSRQVTLNSTSDSPDVSIQLSIGGTLRGRVDNAKGVPDVGIGIIASLSDAGGSRSIECYRQQETDENGRFELDRLPAGYYALVRLKTSFAVSDDQQPEFHIIAVRDGETTEYNFVPETTGIRLFGQLTSPEGNPVPGMGLSLLPLDDASWEATDQLFSITDRNGFYEFTEVSAGQYELYLTPDRGMTVVKIDAMTIPQLIEYRRDVSLSGGGIEGFVRDEATGQPLRNCFVSLLKIETAFDPGIFVARQITRDDGRFYFPNVPEYFYRVIALSTVSNYGHESLIEVLPAADGQPSVLELSAGGSLSLRVIDTEGAPIGAAGLTFLDQDGLAIGFGAVDQTDSQGLFKTSGVRPGTWNITVNSDRFAPRTVVCQVATNLTEELVIELEPKKE